MSITTYGAQAIARYEVLHAAVDSLQWNTAGFTWNESTRRFEITVRDCVVASVRTLAEVKAFSAMHNGRIADSLAA